MNTINKVRVRKDDGYYFPEYKYWFWWRRFTYPLSREVGIQTFTTIEYRQFKTLIEAKEFARSKITHIYTISN